MAESKYTKARVDTIIAAIRLGAPDHLAAKAGGICRQSFYEWIKQYPEFANAVAEAEGARAVRWLTVIDSAAQAGDAKAAEWMLERVHPQEFGRRTAIEMSGANGGPIEIATAKQSAFAKLRERIGQRGGTTELA